jgi:hypothetical protein
MDSETLRQELLGFERHWIQAARALDASSVGSKIPRGSRAIRKLRLWISNENAAGSESLFVPQSGGRARDSGRHGDFRGVI